MSKPLNAPANVLAHLLGGVGLRVSEETSKFPGGLKGALGEADSRRTLERKRSHVLQTQVQSGLNVPLPPSPPSTGSNQRLIGSQTHTLTLLDSHPQTARVFFVTDSRAKDLGRTRGWGLGLIFIISLVNLMQQEEVSALNFPGSHPSHAMNYLGNQIT